MFITFEGGEGVGKTTLINAIAKFLTDKNEAVVVTREPGGTQIGEDIRTILLEHTEPLSPYTELALFLASRAEHIEKVINPALADSRIVLCDRFNDSSVAYQGGARGLGLKEVREVCHFMSGGLIPDLTFYLDLDPMIGLRRAAKEREQDRIEKEAISFHNKVREAFQKIQAEEPKRFILLNAEEPPEVVFQEAIKVIEKYV